MATTTPALIRADFLTQILAITPAHPELQTSAWTNIHQQAAVAGAATRTFALVTDVADPVLPEQGGIWGDGQEHVVRMRVVTSYAGIGESFDDSIISEDGRQLYIALDARKEPTLAGFWYVRRLPWLEGDTSEPGRRWGSHVFEVHYHASAEA